VLQNKTEKCGFAMGFIALLKAGVQLAFSQINPGQQVVVFSRAKTRRYAALCLSRDPTGSTLHIQNQLHPFSGPGRRASRFGPQCRPLTQLFPWGFGALVRTLDPLPMFAAVRTEKLPVPEEFHTLQCQICTVEPARPSSITSPSSSVSVSRGRPPTGFS